MSDDTIYIDETGFNRHPMSKFGRAPSGKRVSLVVTNSRGHNIARVRAYNADSFIQFLSEMLVKTGPGSKNLVMDNPKLNQIEPLFSKWKTLVKSDMRIFDSMDLTHGFNQASLQITTYNRLGWIRESTRFVSLAFRREPM
ncbi:hypothetical protein RF11_01022 [Thelohanellus kitauei]|uniref:Tc1-like transposase DDE domain-containing protein n=1 Tax=Thelohanellus kitauei TaxID=669202 RepID=A0A0C2NH16_THEKT|nr:hypothetical protein RF11_01022 [Thelohanellus kitauei]